MPSRILLLVLVMFVVRLTARAQCSQPWNGAEAVKQFGQVCASKVVLAHVRIVDGTGAPTVEDQNVVIEAGKLTAIEKGADVAADKGTVVVDLHGHTVMPGIVGMHDHLFYIVRPNLTAGGTSTIRFW